MTKKYETDILKTCEEIQKSLKSGKRVGYRFLDNVKSTPVNYLTTFKSL